MASGIRARRSTEPSPRTCRLNRAAAEAGRIAAERTDRRPARTHGSARKNARVGGGRRRQGASRRKEELERPARWQRRRGRAARRARLVAHLGLVERLEGQPGQLVDDGLDLVRRAPESRMMPRSSSTSLPATMPCPARTRSTRPRRGSGVQRQRHQHRPLALDQVVAGRLAGHLGVAEHPEQVVAQLERLAQRQPERGRAPRAPAAGPRPGRRRRAAGARWSTSRTCSAAPSSRSRRRPGRGPARRRPGTARPSPRCGTGRRRPSPAPIRSQPEARSGGAARRPRSSSRSPSRIAAAAPYCVGVAAPAGPPVRGLERPVRRGAAAPGVGGVHEVVVDQRAGVQQLERGAGPEQRRLVVRPTARHGAEAPVAERRAEPLAPADRPCVPRRPGERRPDRAGPAAPACSSRKSSRTCWTRSRKSAGSQVASRFSLITGHGAEDGAVRP